MIRQEIKLTIEGDIEHTVATSLLGIGLSMRRLYRRCKSNGDD